MMTSNYMYPWQSLNECKHLMPNVQRCSNALQYPIESNAICKSLLGQSNFMLSTYQLNQLFTSDYYDIKKTFE